MEKYLRKCLDSLINQSMKEIEIICVNDGSTDNSKYILEEYADNDERIKIINKEHAGLGAARNTGLEYAKGEYIGFVDSDDWVELEMYEKLYENSKKYDSDIVMCPIQILDDNSNELKYDNPYFTLEYFNENFDNCSFNHLKSKEFMFRINVSACNKIYRKKFLQKINAKFLEGLVFEDNPFFYETYLKADRISLIRNFLYYYRIKRKDSIINQSKKNYLDVVKVHENSIRIFKETSNYENYKIELLNYVINSILYRYNMVENKYKEKFFELIKRFLGKLNIKSEDLNNLNKNTQRIVNNLTKTQYYNEYELLNKLDYIKTSHKNELKEKEKEMKKKLKKLESEKKRECEKKLEKKDKIIKEIKTSKSWRITKPLRKINNLLKS